MAEIMLNTIEAEEIIIIEVTGPIIELGVDQGMTMEIEEMTGLKARLQKKQLQAGAW